MDDNEVLLLSMGTTFKCFVDAEGLVIRRVKSTDTTVLKFHFWGPALLVVIP